MSKTNIVSVSWGDHLMFGDGEGRLASPEVLARRLAAWREELGAGIVHWRAMRTQVTEGAWSHGDGLPHPVLERGPEGDWDDLRLVPELAHAAGLEAYLHVTLFDDGWPLPGPEERAVSYHNAQHGRHVAWQSTFCRDHPQWLLEDRAGERQWGVFCLAYPEVRRHFRERYFRLLEGTGFDGLFICLRSQSRPPEHADRFGFNPPIREDYHKRVGGSVDDADFDVQAWRDLLGSYLTTFLGELRQPLMRRGVKLGVGCARGDTLGPPLGNATLEWRRWLERGLVDQLVVDQDSSRCPSMGFELWPMHRGQGYLQNEPLGAGLPPLAQHLREAYGALVLSDEEMDLFVARQWSHRDKTVEAALLRMGVVSGLVFSSFRHDNPGAMERGDWSA